MRVQFPSLTHFLAFALEMGRRLMKRNVKLLAPFALSAVGAKGQMAPNPTDLVLNPTLRCFLSLSQKVGNGSDFDLIFELWRADQ